MSSGTKAPTFTQADLTKDYSIGGQLDQTGQGLMAELMNNRLQGIPQDVQNKLRTAVQQQTNNQVVDAKRLMQENLQGKQLPTGALTNAVSGLYRDRSQQLAGLESNLAMSDYEAKQANMMKALSGYQGLTGLSTNIGNLKNQYSLANANMMNQNAMNKYQIDRDNEWGWGDLVGSLLGAAGQLGGAAIGKSERSLKKDIKFLANINGINLYKFKYKDEKHGKGEIVGAMADEVEKIYPEAIIQTSEGRAINYTLLNSLIGG